MTGHRRHARLSAAYAWAAVALVCVGAGLLLVRYPPPRAFHLDGASLARIDTVTLDGRRVSVSIDAVVQAVGADGQVWIGTADHAVEVRGVGPDSLAVEDRVLVDGRLREDEGDRWLDAGVVTRVEGGPLTVPRRSGEAPTIQPED